MNFIQGFAALATPAFLILSLATPVQAAAGNWRVIGRTEANFGNDRDVITPKGQNDNYRRLKFKVSDAPLNMKHMLVTYDNGAPEKIDVRQNIGKDQESRVIDLRGSGKRSLRKVEFWYETKGVFKGKADVTLYGMK